MPKWNVTEQSDEFICIVKVFRRDYFKMKFLNETGLITYLTPLNVIIYLLVINLIGIFIMYIDKRKAKYGRWRIPEKTLLLVALLGGSIGTITGMYWFRHKTQKLKFVLGFPTILISEMIIIVYFLIKY